jgi:glucosylceramidase
VCAPHGIAASRRWVGWLIAVWFGLFVVGAAPAHADVLSAPHHDGAVTLVGGSSVQATLTTDDLHDALSPVKPLSFGALAPAAETIIVSDATRYQTIIGFGAAVTDSSAWLLGEELAPPRRSAAMRSLFGPTGIRLNYIRIPMGASDFTHDGQPYSYDDLPAGQTDPTLSRFTIAHDQAYILPTLRQMMRLDPSIKTLAMPWSPPAWMKSNDAADNVGEQGVLPVDQFQSYANYFVRFIEAYKAAGVPISAITPGNEPRMAARYPSFVYGGDNSDVRFITQYLDPTVRAAGINVPVYGMDDPGMTSSVTLLHETSRRDLAGIAWHCYAGLGQMSVVHSADPSAQVIMDECSPGIVDYPTAEIAISSLRNWASAVDLWNLALDPHGGPKQAAPGCSACSGLLTINEQTHTSRPNLNYYQFGQVSKFVQRGAVRIASTRAVSDYDVDLTPNIVAAEGHAYGVTPGLDNVAVRNPDGSTVLVAYNNSSRRIHFQVAWHGRGFTATLAARATETFTWR